MAKRPQKKTSPPEASQVKVAEGKKEILPGKSSAVPWAIIVQSLTIAAAVLWIYWPALHGGWLWDDIIYITNNPVMYDPDRLWKAWFEPGSFIEYYPIQETAQWLQWKLWGMDTLGYHLTNVFLHILSALLVWRLLSKFRLRLAWLGGLIFAVHPVQVESVAWIVELKNTLSLPPFLLAMCAWIDYEERGKSKDYGLALGLFLVAMLCKITMAPFPVVILLYGWWKRGRIGWNDVKASVPFWVISLVLGFGAMWVGQVYQEHNHTGSDAITLGGIFSRLACAGLSLSFYFSKCFLPVELMPVYPQWTVDPPTLWQFLPWPVLGVAIYWLWTKRQGWGRHALLGWGFFVLFLAPFLGFNAISYMSFTWVMDHFLYLPIIGLIGLVVAGLGRLDEQLSTSFRPYSLGLVTVVLAFLAFESRSYAKLYLNSETLWSYELQHNPEAYPAHNNLGFALEQTSRLSEAIEQYGQALRLKPDYAEAYYNLGNALQKAGRLSEAIEQYEQALRLKPDYAETHNNLGFALFHNGQFSEAADQFEQALRLQPDDAEAHNNLGNVLVQTGRAPEAMEQYQMALRIRPAYAEAHNNLGNMLLRTGQLSEAMEQYQQALQVNPDYAEAHDNLGSALGQTGRLAEAREQFEQALRIKPDFAEASYNLGTVLLKTGRLSEAIEQYRQTLRIKPDYAQAHDNLGNALLQTGRLAEAIDQFEQALRIKPDYALARNNLARAQALQKTAPANK